METRFAEQMGPQASAARYGTPTNQVCLWKNTGEMPYMQGCF